MAPLARRSWSPRGHTPVLVQRGRSRRKVSVIGALVISPKRRRVRAYFRLHPEANLDGPLVLSFLKQLLRALRVPLELVWDRLQRTPRRAGEGLPRASRAGGCTFICCRRMPRSSIRSN